MISTITTKKIKSDIAIAEEDLWEVNKKILNTVETQRTPEVEASWRPRFNYPESSDDIK